MEIERLFVHVLLLTRQTDVLKIGTVALDGTKIHAHASRYRALSYERAGMIEAQPKAELSRHFRHGVGDFAGRCQEKLSVPWIRATFGQRDDKT